MRNVDLHDFEFIRVITEIAPTGADHDMEVQRDCSPRPFDEAGAGCDSTLEQAAAKFRTHGSASLGRHGGGDGINTDLNQNFLSHATSLSGAETMEIKKAARPVCRNSEVYFRDRKCEHRAEAPRNFAR
jgi:hypothetical protein